MVFLQCLLTNFIYMLYLYKYRTVNILVHLSIALQYN